MSVSHVRDTRKTVDVDPDAAPFFADFVIGWSPDGLARPLEPGDKFAGLAETGAETDPNTGAKTADVVKPAYGVLVPLAQVAGADRTKLGAPVFAVDHLHNYTMTDNGSPVGALGNIRGGRAQIDY